MKWLTLILLLARPWTALVDALRRPIVAEASIRKISSIQSGKEDWQQQNNHQNTILLHYSTWLGQDESEASGSARTRSRRRRTTHSATSLEAYDKSVKLCSTSVAASSAGRSIPATLMRGAFLRIASDLSGGTVFESVKCRVAATTENAVEAVQGIVKSGGIRALWTGTSSRTLEGALVGSVFMLSSTLVKAQIKAIGGGPTAAALGGGLVGGIAQALIMTPCGLVFTSLNVNRGKPGAQNENSFTVVKRILDEHGWTGLYFGFPPMALRQATNWASRAGLTEIARSVLGLQRYGILGEIGSGVLGGLGSCWNTPIETIRVLTQRDLSMGIVPVRTMSGYWNFIVEQDGYPGLFRGITPRACQAIWQTCFMVVVPNILQI